MSLISPLRLAVLVVGATAAVVTALSPTSAVSATPSFTCATDLQQACAIVFTPVCSKRPCY